MLGWHISVYRQTDGGTLPATTKAKYGRRIAVWQAGVSGLDWLDRLVSEGRAIDLGGCGYPYNYTAMAGDLLPQLADGPPHANMLWTFGDHDIILNGWAGRTVFDQVAANECRPDEWLLVEAWDES